MSRIYIVPDDGNTIPLAERMPEVVADPERLGNLLTAIVTALYRLNDGLYDDDIRDSILLPSEATRVTQ